MPLSRSFDVLVLGGGNAALCAAISARRAGASVHLIESAPIHFRGGNSRHTRNLRCMHEAPADVLTGAYPEEEYWQDLKAVTAGRTDEALARRVIRDSATCRDWMKQHGVRFQPSLGGTLQLSRTNAFFLGGGKALVNAYYRAAQALGVEISYESEVIDLSIQDGRFVSATVLRHGVAQEIGARAVVAAAGGFESNFAWLKEAWGSAADNLICRGTPYNMGKVLKLLLAAGAKPVSDATQGHCVAIDARAPKFDGGIVTRVDCVSLGIVVNRAGERFYDEGEDFWPKRYAIWGRLVSAQPDQIAYAIIDAKAMGKFIPPVYAPIKAQSVRELGRALELDPIALDETLARFNAAVRPGTFDHTRLDDCSTQGLVPSKTHWARSLDTPPFYAYPLRPGITFTYLGVRVEEHARVIFQDAKPSPNIFAAGEIMAGNILGEGYIAGIGMAIGTTFGRVAGEEAARLARR
ncbi:MAG TPA: FAD-dependent tricarballylate dehydrogenase TcuA [Usitatibacter sp.]|nr:FAD-dependent tricarballylate dehydrogenase TcuA [Usitatibacter sp.]